MTPTASLSSSALSTHADCPACRAKMFRFDAPDSILARCAECGGVWLDAAGRARVLAPKLTPDEIAFLEAPPAAHTDSRSVFREHAPHTTEACPVCEQRLFDERMTDAAVVVRVCPAHGTFVPAGSFRALRQAAEIRSIVAEGERRPADTQPKAGASLFIAGGVAFGVSLALPALDFSIIGTPNTLLGFQALMLGIPFYPSHLLVAALPAYATRVRGGWAAFLAILFLASGTAAVLVGAASQFRETHAGYDLWAASFFAFAAALAVRTFVPKPFTAMLAREASNAE